MRSMSTPASIVLHGQRPALEIAQERIYFAFGNGRFAYDCVVCDAQCCRGHDYLATTRGSLANQLLNNPMLRFFAQAERGHPSGAHLMRNYAPGCFFLTQDGLCGTQCKSGYSAKPETCRLFPFNSMLLVGRTLVVAPHDSLCPLRVVMHEKSPQSDWRGLMDEMLLAGVAAPVPRLIGLADDGDALIAQERRILELSETLIGREPFEVFADLQVAYAEGLSPTPAGEAIGSTHVPGRARAFLDQCSELLGVDRAVFNGGAQPDIDALLVAMTPPLRSRILLRHRDETSPYGRSEARTAPYYLLALYMLSVLARVSGMRAVSYQTVARLTQTHVALLTLLSHVSVPMVWRRDATISFDRIPSKFVTPMITIAKRLLPEEQSRFHSPLGSVIASSSSFTGLERVTFLNTLGAWLSGRIEPLDENNDRNARRTTMRSLLQRWGLRHMNERTLRIIALRHVTRRAWERKRARQVRASRS